ncbi:unnamed protein product [Meganyctiphanes norvegica]|uniref:Uncharacterized protein n=1 Tax=Meganyctiphanes norvegica TaxID=48144 RepID=A0AAV2R4J2_MEGNR
MAHSENEYEASYMGDVPEFLGVPRLGESSNQPGDASADDDSLHHLTPKSKDPTGGKSSGGSGESSSVSSALIAIAQQLKALTDWKDSFQMSVPDRHTHSRNREFSQISY